MVCDYETDDRSPLRCDGGLLCLSFSFVPVSLQRWGGITGRAVAVKARTSR